MSTELVNSIMTRDVVCVSSDQKIIDVKHIYEKSKFHHHIPVTDDGRLVGMVSLIDFMYRIKGAGLEDSNAVYHELTVAEIMSPNPFAVGPETPIQEIAQELVKGRYRAIPIVENNEVVGIVSTADVIKYYLEQE